MSEIDEFRNRIGQALATIAAGIEELGPVPVATGIDPAEVETLRRDLAEERIVQAQLEERIRVLKDRHDRKVAELEAALATERDRIGSLDHAVQRLRQSNADLRELAGQLRAALDEEIADPALVNRAMLAEIEALRATRAADLAEIEAVYDALRPHLGEAM
jgi:chromosome segregation ATPase